MIAKDLPLRIALREYRLNLGHQYGKIITFLLLDLVILQVQMDYIKWGNSDKK